MKNNLFKTGVIIALLITPSLSIIANDCRDVKLECKEINKADGDYTALERSICRNQKLVCKLLEEMEL